MKILLRSTVICRSVVSKFLYRLMSPPTGILLPIKPLLSCCQRGIGEAYPGPMFTWRGRSVKSINAEHCLSQRTMHSLHVCQRLALKCLVPLFISFFSPQLWLPIMLPTIHSLYSIPFWSVIFLLLFGFNLKAYALIKRNR